GGSKLPKSSKWSWNSVSICHLTPQPHAPGAQYTPTPSPGRAPAGIAEKMFNYREGFRREDDRLPDRFFENAFTIGPKKGSVLDRSQFDSTLTQYYKDRGWDPDTTEPSESKLRELGLDSI
ncbi:MAG: hypothetical protein GX443_15180, partial [Deltaproteobacteria bacterium]|nr:hypothetical protein [Deltaproteobacteria bacterium]